MNTRKAKILYYDGDGGGFGAHIRHLAHLEYLKLRYDIEIISAYPTLDVCFKHSYTKPEKIVSERAILIEDLFKDEILTHEIILNRFEQCAEKDITILSGRHHGPIPWNKLPRIQWIRRQRLLDYLWKKITPDVNGTQANKRIEKSGLDIRHKFVAVHLRTFVDSEEGYSRFLQKKQEQFKLFERIALSRYQEEKISNLLIASDSRRDAIDLSITLESCGFNCYVDQEDFNHSSTAKIFGLKVLVNTDKLSHQVMIANDNITADRQLFKHSLKTLELFLMLSSAQGIICNTSSIGPIAYSMGRKKRFIDLIPNTTSDLTIAVQREGPFV